MDLALELGMMVETLKTSMSEREFVMWQLYAAKRRLPMRRLELHLAQVAQVTGGGTLRDYLFDEDDEPGDLLSVFAQAAPLHRI